MLHSASALLMQSYVDHLSSCVSFPTSPMMSIFIMHPHHSGTQAVDNFFVSFINLLINQVIHGDYHVTYPNPILWSMKEHLCSVSLQGDKGLPGSPGPPVSLYCTRFILQKLKCWIHPDLVLSVTIVWFFYCRDKRESRESQDLMEHQERMALM